MPVSKLKNLTILILLLANLMLALLVVPNRAAAKRQEAELRASLCALYAGQEILLRPESIPDTVSLYTLELKGDPEGEQRAAAALLGDDLLAQDDSTRYRSLYRSSRGHCSIQPTGEFSAQLTGGKDVRNLLSGSKDVLRDMGVTHGPLPEPYRVRAGVFSVTATQTILGVPIFSDGLTMTWSNNRLTALEGICFTGVQTVTRVSGSACMSAADALVRFLHGRYALGWMGTAVTSLQQGYLRGESATASAVRLVPVWRLETDTGVYLIHGLTGEITQF